MVRMAVLRNARAGIMGGIILGLGRAIGETMAVTMLIGNRPEIAKSLFAPGYTMASVIANEFSEATDDLYLSALVEIGLALLIVTVIVNAIARLLVWSITRGNSARSNA
jgi:phosphate transport system permease protein